MSRPEEDGEPAAATRALLDRLDSLTFESKVGWTYNPVDYAWEVHRDYLDRFGSAPKRVLLVGMNPGPWGMAQTGVPFTDPFIGRDWMGLKTHPVGRPDELHEERPVHGWSSTRKEPSGQRLFGFLRRMYGSLDRFFQEGFVLNYCPLVIFDEEGSNLTPDRLLVDDRRPLLEACDPYLRRMVDHFEPDVLMGVGRFAEERLEAVTGDEDPPVFYLPHPSPANPIANRDGGRAWQRRVLRAFEETDLTVPHRPEIEEAEG